MTTYTVAIDPVLIYTINYSFNTLHENLNVYMRTGSVMTVYAVAIDPVLVYTITFSFNTLHEKLNVYMRTGSVMTVYAVPSDPVLVYTIIFPCTQPPGRKINCVYENWITYDHVHWSYTIIFSCT